MDDRPERIAHPVGHGGQHVMVIGVELSMQWTDVRIVAATSLAFLTSVLLAAASPPDGPGASNPPAATDPPAETNGATPNEDATVPPSPTLDTAPRLENLTLQRLLDGSSWPRRAIAAVRLERYRCAESEAILIKLLHDADWQVRVFAIHALAHRGVGAGEDWFADEHEPRVIRTALRCRYEIDLERLGRGVRFLARSEMLDNKLLAGEIAAASGDEELIKTAREEVRTVILRMSREESGAFGPRLARLLDEPDRRRRDRWQRWLLRNGRLELHPGYYVGERGDETTPPSAIAQLAPERFADLEEYITKLHERHVDLAICLDCTASMSGELTAAQGGIDDLMLFVGDVVKSLRIAIVAYRDRHERFETKGWDFTSSVETSRQRLWQLAAEGGGDRREMVYEALDGAYRKLSWNPEHTKVLVLVGDAPPHVGYGAHCVKLARTGAEHGFTTHTIQAAGKDVEHFAEIADAGGGRCVTLETDDALIAEIAGLTLGEQFEVEFRDFFNLYLDLRR